MSSDNSIDVQISCLCGKHKHMYAFPVTTKSLEYVVCHCNSCRKASGGSLYQEAIDWTYPLRSVSENDTVPQDPKAFLKQYDFGPTLDFWFCETCSTKMYWQYKKPDAELELFPTLLPQSLVKDGGVELSCSRQIFVQDTLDGGLSQCFWASNGDISSRHQAGSSGPLYEVPDNLATRTEAPDLVEGECHCGSVKLKLSRKNGQKYPVELDIDEESRLLNSVEVSVWALVNQEDIIAISNMPIHILKTLVESAKDGKAGPFNVYRRKSNESTAYFCNVCSATILLRPSKSHENAPFKIGVGLLRSQSGARAEDILDWSGVQPLELKRRHIKVNLKQIH